MQDTEIEKLLIKISCGDEGAFETLVARYRPLVRSVTSSFRNSVEFDGNSDISDDLEQELTLALYRAALSFDRSQDSVTFGMYAKRCLENCAVSFVRKLKSKRRRELRTAENLKKEHSADRIFPVFSDNSDRDLMIERISECLSSYEFCVFMKYIDGASAGEIAEDTGKNEKSVHNAIFRSKNKIKKLLLP